MELREFFSLFVVHKKLFCGIVGVSVICGVIVFFIQPQTYKTQLTLNIAREGVQQNTDEYTYDDFYRLQADERFADTVVQWIASPYISIAVFGEGDSGKFHAKRLSSQVVDVSFVTKTPAEGRALSSKIIDILNAETQKLNQKKQQSNWFVIIGSKPVVRDATYSLGALLLLSLAIGFFVAFWAVILVHYVRADSQK